MNNQKKLGFLMSHLGTDVAALLLKNAAEFKDPAVDIIAFVNNQVPSKLYPTFAVMNINEAYDYDGVVVATDVATAEKMVAFPGPSRCLYYVWEFEWAKRRFEESIALFHNPRLSVVARSHEDKKVIEGCWNIRVPHVIPDCNLENFTETSCQEQPSRSRNLR